MAGKVAKPDGAIPGGDLMDTDLAMQIVDQLVAAGVRSVTWTGGGEPTLHPAFDEIVEHAAGRIEQGCYTHGGHISPERAALMKQAMSWVYVSLDASNAETYKRLKGVDRFDAAIKGIQRLVAAEGDATVGVGYLVTEQNWRGIGGARYIASANGADYLQFRPTILYDPHDHSKRAEDTGWMTDAIYALSAFVGQDDVLVDLDRFRMYQEWQRHPYATCFWTQLQSVITPNGKVWVCVNKREQADALLGDLSVESFREVWSRSGACAVNGSCRVMCRGHIPNVLLNEIMADREHAAFI